MIPLSHALHGAQHRALGSSSLRQRAVVVGAGGVMGSAVLERVLAGGGFERVTALVDAPIAPALRGLHTVSHTLLGAAAGTAVPPEPIAVAAPMLADCALVVFDRPRQANGREDAWHVPQPQGLPALAAALQRHGVRHLIVVLPHTPALLPQAMKVGLASMDEQAVSALGFDHLVFVRSAQPPARREKGDTSWLQRLADGMLAQLRWMVPQRDQPVRAAKVAAFVTELALALPTATPGTRVAPPELVWAAAQGGDLTALAHAWLATGDVPAMRVRQRRW